MTRIFTDAEFSAQISADLTWRIREISDLKSAIKSSDTTMRKVLLRALIAICYAHWEGYIKFSANSYFRYIALRKFQYSVLDRQFRLNRFLPRLAALSNSNISIAERCALLEEIIDCSDERYKKVNSDLVNTRANLNFEVFADICRICGIEVKAFEKWATFVDIFLLKRRNSIAHGEDTMIAFEDLVQIVEDTTNLMRLFGNEIENRIVLQLYRAA